VIIDTIKRYFVLTYGCEIGAVRKGASWGAYGEAIYQTMLLIGMPLTGLVGAAIVLTLHRPGMATFMLANRSVITLGAAVVLLCVSYAAARSISRSVRGALVSLDSSAASDARRSLNTTFWVVVVASLAMPWLAELTRRLAQ
jgi:hypothetical protein